jgi:hypothetical protein
MSIALAIAPANAAVVRITAKNQVMSINVTLQPKYPIASSNKLGIIWAEKNAFHSHCIYCQPIIYLGSLKYLC